MGGSILPIVFVGEMCICSLPFILAGVLRRRFSGIEMGGTLSPRVDGPEGSIRSTLGGEDSLWESGLLLDCSPHQDCVSMISSSGSRS